MAIQNFFKIDKGLNFKPQASAPTSPNNGDVYYDSTLGQLRRFENGAWSGFSSGGSGAGKNYLSNKNGDFETGTTTGWSLGNVSLTNKFPSGSPTFGSGASGNLSISTVSSGQLAGTYSLAYASSAATTAGNFLASDAFTIDTEDQAKMLTFKLSYKVNSGASNGNFSGTTNSTYAIAIYDVTNSTFIQPAGCYNFVQSSGVGIASGTFQTSASGTSYRILLFNANASAGAITLYIDSVSVGPQTFVQGPAMSDWQAYTPTGTFTTNSTYTGFWRRVGDSAEITAKVAFSGPPDAAYLVINLPSGLVIDTTKITTSSHFKLTQGWGNGWYGTDSFNIQVSYWSTTAVCILWQSSASASSATQYLLSNTAPVILGNGNHIHIHYFVPIVGWSSNTVSSADTDTRVVAMKATTSNTSITSTSTSTVVYSVKDLDTHAAYNTSTGQYTIPVSGKYRITGAAYTANTGTFTISQQINLIANQSGSVSKTSRLNTFSSQATNANAIGVAGSTLLDCQAGDIVWISWNNGTGNTHTLDNSADKNYFCVERLSGPAVVAATETVAACYTSTDGANPGGSRVNFNNKLKDTHNAVTTGAGTWAFTAPVSGTYDIFGQLYIPTGGVAQHSIALQKNGSNFSAGFGPNTSPYVGTISIGGIIDLLAGDTIYLTTSWAAALSTTTGVNLIKIQKL